MFFNQDTNPKICEGKDWHNWLYLFDIPDNRFHHNKVKIAAQGEKIFAVYIMGRQTIILNTKEIHKSRRKKHSNGKMSKGYKKAIHRRNVMSNKHDKLINLSGNQESGDENNLPNQQKCI